MRAPAAGQNSRASLSARSQFAAILAAPANVGGLSPHHKFTCWTPAVQAIAGSLSWARTGPANAKAISNVIGKVRKIALSFDPISKRFWITTEVPKKPFTE